MQLLPGRHKSVDQHNCVHFSEKQLNVSVLHTRGLHPLLPTCAQSLVHSYTCGVFFFFAIPLSMWDLSSPARGSKCPLQWKLSVLTTRPPGNSLICILKYMFTDIYHVQRKNEECIGERDRNSPWF